MELGQKFLKITFSSCNKTKSVVVAILIFFTTVANATTVTFEEFAVQRLIESPYDSASHNFSLNRELLPAERTEWINQLIGKKKDCPKFDYSQGQFASCSTENLNLSSEFDTRATEHLIDEKVVG